MKHRLLGKNFEVSAVGLGCMGMSHAYGSAPDKKEMTELLAQAVDAMQEAVYRADTGHQKTQSLAGKRRRG